MSYVNQEAKLVSGEIINFSFGANWKQFILNLDEKVIEKAEKSFTEFTRIESLKNKSFLDLGCGSGLSSLVALRLDAEKIVPADVDPNSIEATQRLQQRLNLSNNRWEVRLGSVLDKEFLASMGRFSYVYSWGVLHHTGAMCDAVKNLVDYNVKPGGLLHMALYNTHRTSKFWLKIKRACNRWPHSFRPLFKFAYVSLVFIKLAITFHSPFAFVRNYKKSRGMNYFRDVDDWLGGLPYEHCTPQDITDDLADRGFVLLRIRTTNTIGCNEFLFRSPSA